MSVYNDKFVFIHIPKTAGASLTLALSKNYTLETISNDRTENKNFHSTAKDYIDLKLDYKNKFKFSIVRNPWDRATSWYFFRKNIIISDLNRLKKGETIKRLKNNLANLSRELEVMEQGFNFWLKEYISQPWDYTWFSLSHDQSTWLDYMAFDKILKFENLKNDLENVSFLKNLNLPTLHESKNSNIDFKSLYNSYSIDLIADIYKRDIEKFNYDF